MTVEVRPIGPDEVMLKTEKALGAAIRKHGESQELLDLSMYVAALRLIIRHKKEDS